MSIEEYCQEIGKTYRANKSCKGAYPLGEARQDMASQWGKNRWMQLSNEQRRIAQKNFWIGYDIEEELS